MLPPIPVLRQVLRATITHKAEQGHVTTGLDARLDALPASWDALAAFADDLTRLPLRPDWAFVEPDDLAGILAAGDSARPAPTPVSDGAARAEAAFLGRVCGCVLGKPLEINPTLDELQAAFTSIGEWPLNQYVSERVAPHLPRPFHGSWPETVRERIGWVAPDDDLNYSVIGLLALERHGLGFTKDHLRDLWLDQLPISLTFGPERAVLLKAGLASFGKGHADYAGWATRFNPREEFCGALIRVDAYAWAAAGDPALAAELAWKDASFTHLRTGVYGAMFCAAAIAAAFTEHDPLRVFRTAAGFVPRQSRFRRLVDHSLEAVGNARDWIEGYRAIHDRYGEWTHCRVFQEVGTLINTLRFATSVGDGIAKQVMQGNDTDSFGATAGSLLGAFFGPGHLEARWLAPFHDDFRTSLAQFPERSLRAVAARMAALPALGAAQRAAGVALHPALAGEAQGPDAAAGVYEKSPCRG